MPAVEHFVMVAVTEETRSYLRLLSTIEDRPIYSIVSALVKQAIQSSPAQENLVQIISRKVNHEN